MWFGGLRPSHQTTFAPSPSHASCPAQELNVVWRPETRPPDHQTTGPHSPQAPPAAPRRNRMWS
eukprot:6990571-Pyramimonas_sp.AAC.1